MQFLILADNYFPLPLANSICVKSIVDCLKEQGHKCTIINRVDDGKRVEDDENIHSFYCSRRPHYSFPLKTLYKLKQLFVYPHIYHRLVGCYYEQLMQVDLQYVDVILSVCNPIESVLAAMKVRDKYPSIRQIVYNVDTLSDFRIRWIEGVFCPFWRKKAIKVEKEIFGKADMVSFLSSHKDFYSSGKYVRFHYKFLFQEVKLPFDSNRVQVILIAKLQHRIQPRSTPLTQPICISVITNLVRIKFRLILKIRQDTCYRSRIHVHFFFFEKD